MESEEQDEKQNEERVKIYINIEPLGLKIGYVFKKSETFQSIINFVFNQVKKLGVKFELGRINENKTGAILLTENIIGDFLENNDEITVYSEEYGFTRSNLPGEDEHSSLKKVFYLKSVSDLYKSMNFLKKKRNEKLKQKNIKKEEKKEDKKKDSKEEKEEKVEQEEKTIDIEEEKKETEGKEEQDEREEKGKKEKKEKERDKLKSNKKNNNEHNNKIEKSDKKHNTEKKEKKTEEKEKNKDNGKIVKKTTEKKANPKYLSSDDEEENDE